MDTCARGTRNCDACYFESTTGASAPNALVLGGCVADRWASCALKYQPGETPRGEPGPAEGKLEVGKLLGMEAWVCPKCGSVWAWYARGCDRCNGK